MDGGQQRRVEERVEYLVESAVESALIRLRDIGSDFIKAGAISSSRRFIVENKALYDHFNSDAAKIARHVLQAMGSGDDAQILFKKSVERLAARLTEDMSKQRENTAFGMAGTQAKMQRELAERLAAEARNVCTDFSLGMAGGEPLKKTGDTAVTNIMNNSPGASQQAVGLAGQVSQAVTQTYTPLVAELDRLEGSTEFRKLDEQKQAEIRELVQDVRDELSKEAPKESRVRRFGGYLVEKLTEFSLTTAATTIGTVLANLAF